MSVGRGAKPRFRTHTLALDYTFRFDLNPGIEGRGKVLGSRAGEALWTQASCSAEILCEGVCSRERRSKGKV